MEYPKISVVTPSFNQGEFIEQTILSVIGQQYPELEYIIIDGGSTDQTESIIRKYEKHIVYWVSEKDKGQSHAINKGLEYATGDILCWLNSDDYYLPGTLLEIGQILSIDKPELLHGNCIHLNEDNNFTHGSYFDSFKSWDISKGTHIVQPSSFWTRKAYELAGPLRDDLHFGFDWEWFARAQARGVIFTSSPKYFSVYRIHNGQKSDDKNNARFVELIQIEKQLNDAKFDYIDTYLKKYSGNIRLIYDITSNRFLNFLEYRLLKTFHPELIKLMDRVSLKKYIRYCYQPQKGL
ncbi:glycosyltransferase family 2 protein [Mucilaginibacter lappiensis]|uniref:glycosyltransferase family 2 protein n=1 Tax=Mucilaginibacter lappiensis TaxID=354630 RepID=UPI003D23DB45